MTDQSADQYYGAICKWDDAKKACLVTRENYGDVDYCSAAKDEGLKYCQAFITLDTCDASKVFTSICRAPNKVEPKVAPAAGGDSPGTSPDTPDSADATESPDSTVDNSNDPSASSDTQQAPIAVPDVTAPQKCKCVCPDKTL